MDWPRLRCPACAGPVSFEGGRACCDACHAPWPISEDGIPLFLPPGQPDGDANFPANLHAEVFDRENRGHFLPYGRLRALEALLKPVFAACPAPRTLDAGCGTGYALARLQALGARVVGIEASVAPLRFARRRGIEQVYGALAERLPFEDGQFDLALSMDIYEHLDDDGAAMAEAWRVLVPGGVHAVFVPAMPCLWGRCDTMQGHKRRYTRPSIREKLAATGFEVERVTYLLPSFLAPVYAVRAANRWFLDEAKGVEAARNEYRMPPAWVNGICRGVMAAEAALVRVVDFPFGVTVAALARKPG